MCLEAEQTGRGRAGEPHGTEQHILKWSRQSFRSSTPYGDLIKVREPLDLQETLWVLAVPQKHLVELFTDQKGWKP